MGRRVRKFMVRQFSQTVNLDLLKRLLDPYLDRIGLDWTTLPVDDTHRRNVLFDVFARADGSFPPELQFSLFNICILASDAGSQILLEHAADRGVALVPSADAEGHIDGRYLALTAWLDHREIFNGALDAAAFQAFSSRPERAGRSEGIEARTDNVARDLFRDAITEHFASRYQGRYCDVRWFDEGGSVRALILHSSRTSIKNVDADGAEKSLKFREIVQDVIEYAPVSGTISVGAHTNPDARKLVELFAEHLLGDQAFFDDEGSDHFYTLDPISEKGQDYVFNCIGDPDVTDVWIREVQVDEGVGRIGLRKRLSSWSMTVRDHRNALQKLSTLMPDICLQDLRITHVMLEFHFQVGKSRSRVMVKVKPPNIASFRDHSHEAAIFELLTRNGLRRIPKPVQTAAAAE